MQQFPAVVFKNSGTSQRIDVGRSFHVLLRNLLIKSVADFLSWEGTCVEFDISLCRF